METQRTRALILVGWLTCFIALAPGCSTGTKTRGARGEGTPASSVPGVPGVRPPTGIGPTADGDQYRPLGTPNANNPSGAPIPGDAAAPMYGPDPVALHPVTLVLGPGQARGYAHAGAIRALSEAKVPVGAIYGMEVGALLGALYAVNGNINSFEWALLRYKDDVLAPKPNLLSRWLEHGTSDALETQLQQTFGASDIGAMKIALHVALSRPGDTKAITAEKGPLARALRAALATPGNLPPAEWEGSPAQAALGAAIEQQLCDEARAKYGPPVVLIETAGYPTDPSSADLVIRPELSGVRPQDYARETDIAFRGKTALSDRLTDIRRWVGLPPAPASEDDGSKQGGKP